MRAATSGRGRARAPARPRTGRKVPGAGAWRRRAARGVREGRRRRACWTASAARATASPPAVARRGRLAIGALSPASSARARARRTTRAVPASAATWPAAGARVATGASAGARRRGAAASSRRATPSAPSSTPADWCGAGWRCHHAARRARPGRRRGGGPARADGALRGARGARWGRDRNGSGRGSGRGSGPALPARLGRARGRRRGGRRARRRGRGGVAKLVGPCGRPAAVVASEATATRVGRGALAKRGVVSGAGDVAAKACRGPAGGRVRPAANRVASDGVASVGRGDVAAVPPPGAWQARGSCGGTRPRALADANRVVREGPPDVLVVPLVVPRKASFRRAQEGELAARAPGPRRPPGYARGTGTARPAMCVARGAARGCGASSGSRGAGATLPGRGLRRRPHCMAGAGARTGVAGAANESCSGGPPV